MALGGSARWGGEELGGGDDSPPQKNCHWSRKSKNEGKRSVQTVNGPPPALASSYSVIVSSEPLEAANSTLMTGSFR